MLREVIVGLQPGPELDELVEACVTQWEAAPRLLTGADAELRRPPPYSAELRVALALVERLHGCDMTISIQLPHEHTPSAVVRLCWQDCSSCQQRMVTATGAQAALTLCRAILLARFAGHEGYEQTCSQKQAS